MTHAVICGSSCVLCDFTEVKDLEETDSGAKKCYPIYLCASQSIKKKEKSQEEERKCKPSTKPNQKTQTIGNKEKKKEIFSANTCFLRNTICVWKTQSCLIAIHLRESCLVFHSSLRKHGKMFPWEHGF